VRKIKLELSPNNIIQQLPASLVLSKVDKLDNKSSFQSTLNLPLLNSLNKPIMKKLGIRTVAKNSPNKRTEPNSKLISPASSIVAKKEKNTESKLKYPLKKMIPDASKVSMSSFQTLQQNIKTSFGLAAKK
jgi:hypothetical protein